MKKLWRTELLICVALFCFFSSPVLSADQDEEVLDLEQTRFPSVVMHDANQMLQKADTIKQLMEKHKEQKKVSRIDGGVKEPKKPEKTEDPEKIEKPKKQEKKEEKKTDKPQTPVQDPKAGVYPQPTQQPKPIPAGPIVIRPQTVSEQDQNFKQVLKEQSREALKELLYEFLTGVQPDRPEPVVSEEQVEEPVEVMPDRFDEKEDLDDFIRADGDGDGEAEATDKVDPFVVGTSAFAKEDRFYVGREESEDGKSGLARIEHSRDGGIVWKPLSQGAVSVNADTENPLKGKIAKTLALGGEKKLPVFGLGDKEGDNNHRNVYLFKNDDGTKLLKNAATIKDARDQDDNGAPANPQVILQEIAGLAASKDKAPYVFAAVADGGKTKEIRQRLKDADVTGFITAAITAVAGRFEGANQTAANQVKDAPVAVATIFKVIIESVYESENTTKNAMAGTAVDKIKEQENADAIAGVVASLTGRNDIINNISKDNVTSAVSKGTVNEVADVVIVGVDSAIKGAVAAIEGALGWAIKNVFDKAAKNILVEGDLNRTWASVNATIGENEKVEGDGITPLVSAEGFNRGVALLKDNNAILKLENADKAEKVDTNAATSFSGEKIIAFYPHSSEQPITRAVIGEGVSMVWDDVLQRLYLGVGDVARGHDTGAVTNKDGGVVSVLMGKIEKEISNNVENDYFLNLFPVVKNAHPELFHPIQDVADIQDYILGFYQSMNNESVFANARLLNVMHSSGGRPYLIGNMWVGKNHTTQGETVHFSPEVYSIPLVSGDPGIDDTGFVAKGYSDRGPGTLDHEKVLDGISFSEILRDMRAAVDQLGREASLGKEVYLTNGPSRAAARDFKTLEVNNELLLLTFLKMLLIKIGREVDTDAVANKLDVTLGGNQVVFIDPGQNNADVKDSIKTVANEIRKNHFLGKTTLLHNALKAFDTVHNHSIFSAYQNANENQARGAATEIALGYALGRNFESIKFLVKQKTLEFVKQALRAILKNFLDNDINDQRKTTVQDLLKDTDEGGFVNKVADLVVADVSLTAGNRIVAGVFDNDVINEVIRINKNDRNPINDKGIFQAVVNAINGINDLAGAATNFDRANIIDNIQNNLGVLVTTIIGLHAGDTPQQGIAIAIEAAVAYATKSIFEYVTDITVNIRPIANGQDPSTVTITNQQNRSTNANMTTKNDPHAVVGRNSKYLSYQIDNQKIQQLFVSGDTVYASVAGSRGAIHDEAGIFASTAIFDKGDNDVRPKIRAWTPWQRVMGHTDDVAGFGFDEASANFWYLTTNDDGDLKKARVTRWGKGENVGDDGKVTETEGTLASIIDEAFEPIGGVFGLFNFGPGTQGFKEWKIAADGQTDNVSLRYPQFSMFVATGNQHVALIEMGRFLDGTFDPTATFVGPDGDEDPNVFVFSGDDRDQRALKNIGEIVTAEVSRLPLAADNNKQNKGWLFVGGTGGVAVLSRFDNGDGWNTSKGVGLSGLQSSARSTNFPGGSKWQFLQLFKGKARQENGADVVPEEIILDDDQDFQIKDVRKIVSDQKKHIYVLTKNKIFRIEMDGHNGFKNFQRRMAGGALIHPRNFHSITSPGGELFDMMVVQKRGNPNNDVKLLVATSTGLYLSNVIVENQGPGENINWPGGGAIKAGQFLKLDFISKNIGNRLEGDNADGNIHALAVIGQKLVVCRFNVEGGNVQQFVEPYKDANNDRTEYFYKIGDINQGVTFRGPRDFVPKSKYIPNIQEAFAERVPVRPNTGDFLPEIQNDGTEKFKEIDFGVEITSENIGLFTPDSASGSVYTSGEFGVRLNK